MRKPTPNIMDELLPAKSETTELRSGLKWDYSQLGDAAGAVIEHTIEIKRNERRANEAVVEAGRHLIAVKESLSHGQWGDWLATEFSMTDRTARTLMSIAERFDGKTEIISDLTPTVLGLLASPSVPEAAVEQVVAATSDGKVSVADAKAIIDQHRPKKAPIRYESGLPALNVPAPGAVTASMAAKIPIEDWELEDFVEQVATEYYGKVTRMVGDSMMLAAQSQAGAYWAKLRRVLEPFDVTAERIEAAVAATVERLVGERRALRPGSPEAKQLGREIKSATWGDQPLKQPQRFAEVWELERLLAQWTQPLHATVLRSTANMRSGGMWWDARKVLQALGGVNYRDRDLVSALHNLASQKEQRGREGDGETQPAESGREGEGETPAEKLLVDWTDEDWAAYGFEAKAPAVESTEAAEDAAALDLVVDGDQPLPAWVDGEADKPVTLRDLELAAQAQAAPVSHREGYDSDEWYTPGWVIEAATAVMGQIDLDPASCELAQETVQAGLYWTKQQDGCRMAWFGRVWLNPPYSAPGAFVDKLLDEYTAGNVQQACVLLNNATETKWFQRLLARFPVCFFSQRLAFWRHDHEDVGARQGQALFYLGPDVEKFVEVFGEHGIVVKRLD